MATVNILFERQVLAAIEDGAQLEPHTPLGRVPVLILEDGETLIDSAAIIDHILEVGDPTPALLPATVHDRRRVLYLCTIATEAMEKGVASSSERFQRPPPPSLSMGLGSIACLIKRVEVWQRWKRR